jgi:hypothetical protein
MPLRHGRTSKTIKANVAKNIRIEIHSGRSMRDARRIAYGTAHTDARRAGLRPAWLKPMKGGKS